MRPEDISISYHYSPMHLMSYYWVDNVYNILYRPLYSLGFCILTPNNRKPVFNSQMLNILANHFLFRYIQVGQSNRDTQCHCVRILNLIEIGYVLWVQRAFYFSKLNEIANFEEIWLWKKQSKWHTVLPRLERPPQLVRPIELHAPFLQD